MIGGMGSDEFAKHGSLDAELPRIDKATGRVNLFDTPATIGGVSWALIVGTDTTTVWQLLLLGERTDTYVAIATFDPPGMPPGVSYQGVYARLEALEWAKRVDGIHAELLRERKQEP